jgi:hypothetical protein
MLAHASIDTAYREGRALWPGINVAIERFADMARDLDVSQDGLLTWPGDFYLSCAAGHGDAKAITVIDERFVRRLEPRIRRLGSTPAAASDALQAIRERLFAGSRPRLRSYNAAGPLEQWIKVVIGTASNEEGVRGRPQGTANYPKAARPRHTPSARR